MARMYPNQIDPKTESDAERLLYDAFRDELGQDYTVFHSVNWQSLDDNGRRRDGEADFVIAHPEAGILVLEAKGGTIRFDPRTHKWTSTGRWGKSHPLRPSPFTQALESKYVLRDLLAAILGIAPTGLNLGHGVAFPDVVAGNEFLAPDKPRQIILDRTDLADVGGWVARALAYWRGQKTKAETAPGQAAVEALLDMLGKVRELRPAMWGDFVLEQKQLIQLTEQQYLILDMLNQRRRAAIQGCAGSGKTMIAVEKAIRLARQKFRVLLTCFNKNLAGDLRARLSVPRNLDIIHFHELCYNLAQEAEVLPVKEDDSRFYDQQLPEALLEAADKLELRYDAIIVDEGQDFEDHWWIPLQNLLRDPDEGLLYIFYDDNQRIYVHSSQFPIQEPPYSLTINCRNTQNIHRLVAQCYQGDGVPTARGPLGRPVEVASYRAETLAAGLMELLHRLVFDEHVPADEIAVLSTVAHKSPLRQAGSARLKLTRNWPPAPGQVYWSTIQAFKGLERSVIVLADIHRWPTDWTELESLFYVGCSRARNHLVVLLPDDVSTQLREFFTTR